MRKVGRHLAKRLADLQKKHASIREVRCIGLMAALELDSADRAKQAVAAMMERRIIINRTHDTVLRFLPPYIVTEQHIDEMAEALDEVLSAHAQGGRKPPRAHGGGN